MALTYNLRDGVLVIKDNAGTAATLAVSLMDGTLKFSVKRDVKIIRARGLLDHLRLGDEQIMPVSFDFKYTELLGAAVTPYEFLTGTGGASGYTYTAETGANYDLVDAGDVKVVQLFFTVSHLPSGSEIIELPNFVYEDISFSEGDDFNLISVSGNCIQQKPILT